VGEAAAAVPWPWPITVAFLVQVVLPSWFLASLALERSSSYASFCTKAAAFGLFFILIFFVGRWDLVGVWLRYGLICSDTHHRSTLLPRRAAVAALKPA
jgi:hypothetical protein